MDKNYYSVVFEIKNQEEFKKFHKQFCEMMKGETQPVNGAKAIALGWGNKFAECDDNEYYSEYLLDFIEQHTSMTECNWTFTEWKNNGKPIKYEPEDHTEESYDG